MWDCMEWIYLVIDFLNDLLDLLIFYRPIQCFVIVSSNDYRHYWWGMLEEREGMRAAWMAWSGERRPGQPRRTAADFFCFRKITLVLVE
jgi:hypothetical protein